MTIKKTKTSKKNNKAMTPRRAVTGLASKTSSVNKSKEVRGTGPRGEHK